MRILITRPAKEAALIAEMLVAEGHQVIVSPLLDIRFIDGPPISLSGFQAILATSANGIHALARRTAEHDKPVYAVGPETAAAAVAEGFRTVEQSTAGAETLALAVQQQAHPADGPLLYAAARDRTGHLETALSKLGFAIHTEVLYAAQALPLSETAIAALRSGEVDAVMLFSARSARLFVTQIADQQLQYACESIVALCISPAVATALGAARFRSIDAAASPNRDSMLALLRALSDANATS